MRWVQNTKLKINGSIFQSDCIKERFNQNSTPYRLYIMSILFALQLYHSCSFNANHLEAKFTVTYCTSQPCCIWIKIIWSNKYDLHNIMRVTFVIFIRHLCFCLLLREWSVLFLLKFMFGFGFVIFQNLSSIIQISFLYPVHQIERVISSNGLCQCNMNIKFYYKYNAMHINVWFYLFLFLFSCSILLVSFGYCFKLFRHIFYFSAI